MRVSITIGSRTVKETSATENVLLFGLFRCSFIHARTNSVIFAAISLCVILSNSRTLAESQANFEILNLSAKQEDRLPTVVEHQSCLQVLGEFLNVCATIRCSVPDNESWRVGFIQQIDSKIARAEYSNAYTSWEPSAFPLCDTCIDSASCPWYDKSCSPLVNSNQVVEIAMNDNLSYRTPWKEPAPPSGVLTGFPDLRAIERTQKFTLYVAARRESDGKCMVLRRIKWEQSYKVKVDPDQPLGHRAVAQPLKVKMPEIDSTPTDDRTMKIVDSVLNSAVAANENESFWWTPKPGLRGTRTCLSKPNGPLKK